MRAPLISAPDARPPVLSRRAVLLGAAGMAGIAGVTALSGCTDSSSGVAATGASGGSGGTEKASSLIAIFDSTPAFSLAGKPQRFAFSVAGSDGVPTKDAPASLDMTVAKLAAAPTGAQASGTPIGPPITVPRHVDGVPIAYYPLRFTPDAPGYYQVSVVLDGTPATASFQVGTPADAKVPQVGDKLISVDTPTTANHRGVDPICTRMPQMCPLHDVDLVDTLTAGKPIAFLISTPEFCQIGVCGPVLELLLEQHDKQPQFSMVHAEVYQHVDPATGINGAQLAPAVQAYNLTYEPVLFVAKPDGTIVERLDNVFDRGEIADALAKVS
jgi:hypothetical protein